MNKYMFAEQLVNKLPWVKAANVQIEVSSGHKSFKPIKKCSTFSFGSEGINDSMVNYLSGLIDGLMYAYENFSNKIELDVEKIKLNSYFAQILIELEKIYPHKKAREMFDNIVEALTQADIIKVKED